MARPLSLLLSLLLLFLVPHQARSRSAPQLDAGRSRADCAGRWIHIRSLPPRFNADLLARCADFPILTDAAEGFCPYAAHHGLGPRTHNRSRSWYRTDTLLLEPLFHHRILEYPCLTPDPSLADAVFLPYYTALDALPFLYEPALFNSSALHGLELYRFLQRDSPHIWARARGHDHFLVAARPAWDLSQDPGVDPPLWGTSFLERPEFFNVTVLVPESRPWPWQERAVPHPTSFHPATLARLDAWITRARRSRRTKLMLFAGGGGGSGANIRASIRAECENRTDVCEWVDCSEGACKHDPIRYMLPMLRARFCLQPPGDTPTRRATFDGFLAGCIPVFFEDLSARAQYGWHLPKDQYNQFSLYIPKEEVVFGGVRIAEVLEGIPAADVRRMRERVLEIAPRVMYRRHGSSAGLRARPDAFDIAVEGALRRIKRRVRALDDPERLLLRDDEEGDEGG